MATFGRGFVTESWAVPFSPLAAATWAARKGLAATPPVWVAHELRRLRVWRTEPAVFGAGIGAGPSAAYARWMEVHGLGRAAEGMVHSEASMAWPFDPLTLALVGYWVGLVIAEATRRHPVPGSPAARLTARVPANYLTRPARWIPVVFAGVTLLAATVARAAGKTVWWPALAAVGLAAVVLVVQRWVVRRPQRLEGRDDLRADDVLRSSAAHGLSGASGAPVLIIAVGATDAATRAFGIDAFAGAIVGPCWRRCPSAASGRCGSGTARPTGARSRSRRRGPRSRLHDRPHRPVGLAAAVRAATRADRRLDPRRHTRRRASAADLELAPGTVARAYRELETADLVESRGRRGTRVVDTPPAPIADERDARLAQAADEFALRATELTTVVRQRSGR